jgi:hypothetical protein
MNSILEIPEVIKLEDDSIEQNARNNFLFESGALRYNLNLKSYFWTEKVNQNVNNN